MPYQDMIIEAAGAALERTPDKQRIGRFSGRVLGSPAGEMKPEEAVPVSYDDKQLQLSLQQLELLVVVAYRHGLFGLHLAGRRAEHAHAETADALFVGRALQRGASGFDAHILVGHMVLSLLW